MNSNFFDLSNRKKRDVLSELLTGKSSDGIISNKELNALHKLIDDTPQNDIIPSNEAEKLKKTASEKKKKKTKRKTTHYLSEKVFDNLDHAAKEIRAIVPENLRSRVSKSQIINQALIMTLKEFETKGVNSRLVRKIIKK